jgi:hypothetical protein
MTWDEDDSQRRMRNYSIMLKAALVCLAMAVLMVLAGGAHAVSSGDAALLIYGLLFLVWSTVSAYLTIDSTVRIIETDTKDSRRRSE